MKTYTVKELNEVLRLHSLWLQKDKNGIKANLSGADLSGADLRGVNLSWANLSGANLRWVNFSEADLSGADLHGVNLSRADLRWADLSGADLSGADLSRANLSRANLSGANLSWADLSGADLDDKIISVSRIGSRKDVTHYNYTKDIVFCECWHGTLKEFEKRVKKTHKDNPQYLKEYLQAIKFFNRLNGINPLPLGGGYRP